MLEKSPLEAKKYISPDCDSWKIKIKEQKFPQLVGLLFNEF
jgi:hypothetical protein